MRNYHLSVLLGLATTTTVALYAPLPVQAEAKEYQIVSGKESLRLDPEGLAVLESIGLSFVSVENTAVPAPDYDYGFELLPPISDPNVRATNSTFTYDSETGYFAPLGGTEELVGSIFFNVDTTKLNLAPQLELGDFSISYSFSSGAEAVSIIDTANTGLSVLNVEPPSYPPTFDFESRTWTLDDVDVLASQEFNDLLVAAGATTEITGLKLVEGRLDRGFVEVGSTPVPEPGSVLGILAAASVALAARKRRAT